MKAGVLAKDLNITRDGLREGSVLLGIGKPLLEVGNAQLHQELSAADLTSALSGLSASVGQLGGNLFRQV